MNHASAIRRALTLALLTLLAPLAMAQGYRPECPPERDPALWDLMNRAIDLMYENDPMGIGPLLADES
ncbi:MAG: hypothetical protein ACF8LL_03050, partial [Phycisphaerales bacterium]